MQQFTTASDLEKYLGELRREGRSIGFVPTMGALHAGHRALVERSVQENDATVCSIFVNPTQFNNPDDLTHYPRTLSSDLEQLQAAGAQAVYTPRVAEMYPDGLATRPIDLGLLGKVMEAAHRPGHFDGVVTIVRRLFEQIKPNRAYFGTKDYQQLLVIKKLVETERMEVDIRSCETVRDADGLAKSSRNARLAPDQRIAALAIYRALSGLAADAVQYSIPTALQRARTQIESTPGLQLEYLELADAKTLEPIEHGADLSRARAFAACHCGPVRLIDNMALFT